ncbi:MAG: VanW family protein [Candidatus Levyibacteriota bacterium]
MNTLISLLFLPLMGFSQPGLPIEAPKAEQLAVKEFSLEKRYADSFVNGVFRDNILLVLKYSSDEKIDARNIDWKKVNEPFVHKLILKPGETFAYHEDVLPKYDRKVTKTTNALFNYAQGFKSSGRMFGDGVCHLASLLYWVAKDAGLDAVAPVRHDFANIPEVPREFGVSIYNNPEKNAGDQAQNLYITNNKGKDVTFVFDYDGKNLKITAEAAI